MNVSPATATAETVVADLQLAGDVRTVHWWGKEVSTVRAADALLTTSLLPAMRVGEPVVCAQPVSPRLLAAVDRAQDVICNWEERYPGWGIYQRVVVDAAPRADAPLPPGRGTAAFFTAGADSFYTALRHRDEIDALVFVSGFDVALDDEALGARVTDGVRHAAAELGLPLVEVRTDVRAFADPFSRWDHYHGAALAAVAHLLAPHFSRVYVPATQTYAFLAPLGSHPLLDPLWSSEDVELVHDGLEASRLDKLAVVASEPAARHWLRVCWENRNGAYNCGRCEKCLRTMVALDALGELDAFTRVPHRISTLDIERVKLPDLTQTWAESLARLERSGHDPRVARAVRRRLYGRSTRALHRAVYYAHRARALFR